MFVLCKSKASLYEFYKKRQEREGTELQRFLFYLHITYALSCKLPFTVWSPFQFHFYFLDLESDYIHPSIFNEGLIIGNNDIRIKPSLSNCVFPSSVKSQRIYHSTSIRLKIVRYRAKINVCCQSVQRVSVLYRMIKVFSLL